MHHTDTTTILEGVTTLWSAAIILGGLAIATLFPIMAISITLSLRGIRRELRDIAEQLALPSRRVG